MSDLATCLVCGKKYKACLSCRDQMKIRPWQRITDTAECYKIFFALSQYNNGYITKEEARQELSQIKYDKSVLYNNIQKSIDKIMDTHEPIEKDTTEINAIDGKEIKPESENKEETKTDLKSETKNSNTADFTASIISIDSNTNQETSPVIPTTPHSMVKPESVRKNKQYKNNTYKNK